MRAVHLVIAILVVLNIFLTRELLLKSPTIWSDEAAFAHIAENILKENRMGYDLYGDMYPGFKEFVGGQTPLFYYLLAGWFKIVGISIENQRLLSVIVGGLFLSTIYFLSKLLLVNRTSHRSNKLPWVWGLAIGGLLLDAFFLQSTRVSRQEIFILLFAAISFYFYMRSFASLQFTKRLLIDVLLSGFFASLAALTHALSIFIAGSILFHMFLTKRLAILKEKNLYLFLLGLLLPISAWVVMTIDRWGLIQKHISMNIVVKNTQETWLLSIMKGAVLSHKLIFGAYMLVAVVFIIFLALYLLRQRLSVGEGIKITKEKYLFLGIILIFTWASALYGKMLWYYVYPIPFTYLALIILLLEARRQEFWSENSSTRWSLMLLQGVFLLIVGANIYINYHISAPLMGQNYSYHKLEQKVLTVIPEGKSVFLVSSPELYYVFREKGKDQIYEFLPFYAEKSKYFELLNKADYIIRSEPWDDPIFDEFLPNYIQKNSLRVYKTSERFQYEVFIIELKPVSERIFPE